MDVHDFVPVPGLPVSVNMLGQVFSHRGQLVRTPDKSGRYAIRQPDGKQKSFFPGDLMLRAGLLQLSPRSPEPGNELAAASDQSDEEIAELREALRLSRKSCAVLEGIRVEQNRRIKALEAANAKGKKKKPARRETDDDDGDELLIDY
jgi:hypothetical protein